MQACCRWTVLGSSSLETSGHQRERFWSFVPLPAFKADDPKSDNRGSNPSILRTGRSGSSVWGDWAEKRRVLSSSSSADKTWKVFWHLLLPEDLPTENPPSENCQGTLEQATEPTNASSPGNELVTGVYPAFIHMWTLPMTPKREKATMEKTKERRTCSLRICSVMKFFVRTMTPLNSISCFWTVIPEIVSAKSLQSSSFNLENNWERSCFPGPIGYSEVVSLSLDLPSLLELIPSHYPPLCLTGNF